MWIAKAMWIEVAMRAAGAGIDEIAYRAEDRAAADCSISRR